MQNYLYLVVGLRTFHIVYERTVNGQHKQRILHKINDEIDPELTDPFLGISNYQHIHQVSQKSVHNFWVNLLTERQTNKSENITSLGGGISSVHSAKSKANTTTKKQLILRRSLSLNIKRSVVCDWSPAAFMDNASAWTAVTAIIRSVTRLDVISQSSLSSMKNALNTLSVIGQN